MDQLFQTRYLLKVAAADMFYFLSKLTDEGVTVENVNTESPLEMIFSVKRKDLQKVKLIAQRMGVQIKIMRIQGFRSIITHLRHRFVVACGIVLVVFLTIYIPSRIFFVSIEGNEHISDGYLLEQAQRVGLYFGASRKNVRSERMKNALLQAVPELKWAGINTYGCRAEIYVIERNINNTTRSDSSQIQGVYAARDGVVSSITVTNGTSLCKPGQGIREGQLLISGYTDSGLVVRVQTAEGVVRAVTQRKIKAVFPLMEIKKGEIKENKTHWSMQIGKKQIKLHIDSGNSGAECGKIYKTYTLTLPGGFCLPLSIVKETVLDYETVLQADDENAAVIEELAHRYIADQMVDGEVIHAETSVCVQDGVILFTGVYTCEESVGKLRNEEIG